jgi:diguanylate cyclase (GGDEF)-like protein
VLKRGDAPVYELRDLHGASRAVAYLTLASAPYVLVTGCLTPGLSAYGIAAIITVSIFLAGTGVISWRSPSAVPRDFWFLAPIVASVLISALNVGTRDASTGAQLFYLWPVIYAANFLSRRVIYLNLAIVFVGDAIVVTQVLDAGKAAADWVAMLLAMTMAAAVVHNLRARADKLREVLEQQAHADPLTGLANRRAFDESLAGAGTWAEVTGGSLALITVDLDHFKTINDTYGHVEGDRVLQAVASAMKSVAGRTGVAARLGGDEFVLLLRSGRRAAVEVADALRDLVAARTDLASGPPSLSIGVSVLAGDAGAVADLVAASDAALYEAKTAGRGRVAVAELPENRMPSFVPRPRH